MGLVYLKIIAIILNLGKVENGDRPQLRMGLVVHF
jgi:hypothetical protein